MKKKIFKYIVFNKKRSIGKNNITSTHFAINQFILPFITLVFGDGNFILNLVANK